MNEHEHKQEDEVLDLPELAPYDKQILRLSKYLANMDKISEAFFVGEDGKIDIDREKIVGVKSDEEKMRNKYIQLTTQFAEVNEKYRAEISRDPAVVDCQVMNGAVVVIVDSSKGIPEQLKDYADYDTEDHQLKLKQGFHRSASSRGLFLGLVCVDINRKDPDGVSPSVTLTHELRHHNVMIADYLLSKDPDNHLKSAFRNSVNELRLNGTKLKMAHSYMYFDQDADEYGQMLERQYQSGAKGDGENVKDQLAFLNEYHSSFLQGKPDWISAASTVYSPGATGKHWELVGNNPEDIQKTKEIVALCQGFYLLRQISGILKSVQQRGEYLPADYASIIGAADEYYALAGAILGASRCIPQAHRMLRGLWQAVRTKHAAIVDHPNTSDSIGSWEQSGDAAEHLRETLLGDVA